MPLTERDILIANVPRMNALAFLSYGAGLRSIDKNKLAYNTTNKTLYVWTGTEFIPYDDADPVVATVDSAAERVKKIVWTATGGEVYSPVITDLTKSNYTFVISGSQPLVEDKDSEVLPFNTYRVKEDDRIQFGLAADPDQHYFVTYTVKLAGGKLRKFQWKATSDGDVPPPIADLNKSDYTFVYKGEQPLFEMTTAGTVPYNAYRVEADGSITWGMPFDNNDQLIITYTIP